MRTLDIKPIKKNKPKPKVLSDKDFKFPWFKIGTAVIGAGAVVFFSLWFLPEARLVITTRTEPVTRDLEIRVASAEDKINAAELAIPGKIFQQEMEGEKTYLPSGKRNVGKQASGFVYIYNFSKSTLILKKETTVLYAGGRKYFMSQDVSGIRPTARIGLEDEEIDKSSLIAPVAVVAEGPGEQYNLQAGARLEISNEAFGHKPSVLYASATDGGITGGTTAEIKIVTEQDIVSAFETLEKELKEQAKLAIVAENPGLEILDAALAAETLEKQSSAKAGDEKPEFEAKAKIRLKAFAYSRDDVLTLIRERIKKLLPENKTLKESGDFTLVAGFSEVDLDQAVGRLAAHFEDRIAYKIDKNELVELIRGKTPAEIKELLLSRVEIEEVKLELYPFWVKKAPRFNKKIHLDTGVQ